jgi:hypothetical protein
MKAIRQVSMVILVAAGFCAFAAPAATIYDNTGTWLGGYGWTALEQGDEIHAAGSDRLVTRLTVGVSRQGQPGSASFQARLYANDGANGQPGTMLWQSALFAGVPLSGGVQLIPFDVPQVFVPDTFTWTLQVSQNSAGYAVGLVDADPPSVGSSPNYDWFGNSSGWGKIQYYDWMARVEAVPEPSGFVLLLVGLGLLRAKGATRARRVRLGTQPKRL